MNADRRQLGLGERRGPRDGLSDDLLMRGLLRLDTDMHPVQPPQASVKRHGGSNAVGARLDDTEEPAPRRACAPVELDLDGIPGAVAGTKTTSPASRPTPAPPAASASIRSWARSPGRCRALAPFERRWTDFIPSS